MKSKQPILLKSPRLSVEIAPPGTMYQGSRFDWTAFITQVILDEQHTFAVPESLIPGQGSGGVGFCNEFGISEPIGYDDAAPGHHFPKLGVGLLRRPDDEAYNFFRPYEITPFPIRVETTDDRCVFTVDPLDCGGYAAGLTKSVTVHDNTLRIDYRLENVGQKPLRTTEYCHNFIGIDRQPVGPDYCLSFPYPVRLTETPGILDIHGESVSWKGIPTEDFYFRPEDFSQTSPHRWELFHCPSGLQVTEESFFQPDLIAVWGKGHVISPEVFVRIDLKPGESMTWARQYSFSMKSTIA